MYNTLPGGVLEVWEERFECVVGAGLVVITIIKFSALAVAEKKRWLTAQSLVFLYFAVRFLCLTLYNYLYAKKTGGIYVLRVEDTDQSRLVEGAVEGMLKAMKWAGVVNEEGVVLSKEGKVTQAGDCGPYVQIRGCTFQEIKKIVNLIFTRSNWRTNWS